MSLMPPSTDQIHTLKLPDQPTDLDLSNDGKLLAVAIRSGKGGLIRVLNTKDGSTRSEYAADAAMGWGVAFIDGGKSLAYVVRDDDSHRHSLFRVEVGATKPKRITDWTQSHFRVAGMSRNRKGTMYALNGSKTEIRQASDDDVIHEVPAADTEQTRSCFDSKGTKIWIAGAEQSQVVQVDIASGKELRRLTGPAAACEQVVSSPDDRYLVALGELGKGIAIYDLAGADPKRVLQDDSEIYEWNDDWSGGGAFAFPPDSSLAVFITVKVETLQLPKWELADERPKATEPGAYMWYAASAYDVPMLAFGGMKSKSVIWFPLVKS